MKCVTIIGHFGDKQIILNGQVVKTKTLAAELENELGAENVARVDTCRGAKSLLKCFFQSLYALKNSDNIIMLPAYNGVSFFAPVLLFGNLLFKRKLHYSVIGGWLPKVLKKRKCLCRQLKKFDFIYVETSAMKKMLEDKGFQNVSVVPNCKELQILAENKLVYAHTQPYKLCTFSRITPRKGIEDAIAAVGEVNEKLGRVVYTLELFGQVDPNETLWFEDLQKSFPHYVCYGGMVPFDKSVEVLKDYFALIFPTRYFTEGIPGTIIDAYAAGVPVISARWENYNDIIDETTGIGFDFNNTRMLAEILEDVSRHPEKILDKKARCLKRAEDYIPGIVISQKVTPNLK